MRGFSSLKRENEYLRESVLGCSCESFEMMETSEGIIPQMTENFTQYDGRKLTAAIAISERSCHGSPHSSHWGVNFSAPGGGDKDEESPARNFSLKNGSSPELAIVGRPNVWEEPNPHGSADSCNVV